MLEQKEMLLGAVALQSVLTGKPTSITTPEERILDQYDGRYVLRHKRRPAAILRDPELFRDLVYDVEKFLHLLRADRTVFSAAHSWTKEEQATRRLPGFLWSEPISCDVETTGLSSAIIDQSRFYRLWG